MTESTITAGLIAAVLALARVIEWLMKKYSKNGNEKSHVSLHPEVSRQIRETYEGVIMLKRDVGDIRMHDEEFAKMLSDIAECLRKTAETQEKVAQTLEKIDRRQELENEIRKLKVAGE